MGLKERAAATMAAGYRVYPRGRRHPAEHGRGRGGAAAAAGGRGAPAAPARAWRPGRGGVAAAAAHSIRGRAFR